MPTGVASLVDVSEAQRASLEAAGRSPNTLLHYDGAAEQLPDWLREQGHPLDIARIRPEAPRALLGPPPHWRRAAMPRSL